MNEVKATSHDIEYYNGMENFHDAGEVLEGTKFKVQIKIAASFLPPMGYEVLKVCFHERTSKRPEGDVVILKNGAENKYLVMHIQEDGTLSVTNKQTQETYHQLNTFVEKGDDCIESSSIEVKYRLEYQIQVPEKVVDHHRVQALKPLKICSDVSLKANSQTIDFVTKINNHSCDHIVRVCFEDIYKAAENCSQDQFGTIIRQNVIKNQKSLKDGATEYVLPIYAMQRFVKLDHQKSIMAVLSKGPLEYEIENNQKICLTLLRSVGKFGKADLLIRPGRSSGYRMDAPSSQLLNQTITSEYSLFFGTKEQMSKMIQTAEVINTPVQTRYLNDISRRENLKLDWSYSAITLDERVEFMALKKAENSEASIFRILNNREVDVADVELFIPINKRCYLCDVQENKQTEVENQNGKVIIKNIVSNTFVTVIIE